MEDRIRCLNTTISFADDFEKLSFEIGNLGKDILWVCDTNTARMVRPLPEPNVIVSTGESSKTLANVERIIQAALENRFTKSCTFLALGGGTICDLTGLAASLYMRGCNLTLVPTTLLAMADACVGGANGINFRSVKSVIGTKYPADKVIICRDCLKSLSAFEFSNGLAEIIKHSLLTKNETLLKILITKSNKVLDRDPDTIKALIKASILVKKEINEPDESGQTHIPALSLGHTFGHAFEGLSHLSCTHGQAIAWGVCKSLEASAQLGLCSTKLCDSVRKLYTSYGYKVDYKINRGDWIEFRKHLMADKKRSGLNPVFILLTCQGEYVCTKIDEDIIRKLVIKDAVN